MIDNYESWKSEYKKNKKCIWIRVSLSDKSEYYFKYDNYSDWYKVQDICKEKKISVDFVRVQYKSNFIQINTSDCQGVYLIRSMIGRIGVESINTITIGTLHGEEIHKDVYSLPDLVKKDSTITKTDECFKEALCRW